MTLQTKKMTRGTRELYRYTHVGISASTRAGSCRSHSRGILRIGRHYLALTPVVRVVVAMEPAVIGPCAGVGVERGIRVSRLVNRQLLRRAVRRASAHIACHHALKTTNLKMSGGDRVNCGGRGKSCCSLGTPFYSSVLTLLIPLTAAFVFCIAFVVGGCFSRGWCWGSRTREGGRHRLLQGKLLLLRKERKQSSKGLLVYRWVPGVLQGHTLSHRGETLDCLQIICLEVSIIRQSLASPSQFLSCQQVCAHVLLKF